MFSLVFSLQYPGYWDIIGITILGAIIIYQLEMFSIGNIMREMMCWTLAGRKKIFLVDENNNIIKELRDLGPLSELEMRWVRSNSGMPYKEWLKTLDKEEGEEVAQEE